MLPHNARHDQKLLQYPRSSPYFESIKPVKAFAQCDPAYQDKIKTIIHLINSMIERAPSFTGTFQFYLVGPTLAIQITVPRKLLKLILINRLQLRTSQPSQTRRKLLIQLR